MMGSRASDDDGASGGFAALGLFAAMVLLGVAVFDHHGEYSAKAFGLVLLALGSGVAAVVWAGKAGGVEVRRDGGAAAPARLGGLVVLVGLAVAFGFNGGAPPGWHVGDGADVRLFSGLVSAAALAAGAAVFGAGWVRLAGFGLALGLFGLAGFWVIDASPEPVIDVMVVHREAAAGLLEGRNPYAMRFTQAYSVEHARGLYGDALLDDAGRMNAGYTYLPVSLVVVTLGHLVGDVRVGHLLAVMATAALIWAIGDGRWWARAAAVGFLFSPRNWFVVEQGWTEPVSAALLAGFVWCVAGGAGSTGWRRALAPWVFGLLLVSKQYLPLMLPLAWICLPETRRWDFLWRAGVAGAAVTLPFFVWDPGEFWRATVWLLVAAPFRPDGLSVWSWLAALGWSWRPTGTVAIVVTLIPLVVAGWGMARLRAPGPFRFAVAVALGYLGVFLLGKQAFCNYYFFVIAALGVAGAAWCAGPSQSAAQKSMPV